ncbi:MAG: hypothetical protein ACK4NC_00095 [Candidatus Gracilibacteria bacterium]
MTQNLNITAITEELKVYGENHKLRGLEGRIFRGLDIAGMLAVETTRKLAEQIADKMQVSMSDLEKVTNELHVGTIWEYSDKFLSSKDAAVNVWMILAERCIGPKIKPGDLSSEEFIEDTKRVITELSEAAEDPQTFLTQAVENQVIQAKKGFEIVDGVAFIKQEGSFLHAAIAGLKSGISERVSDNETLFHVGAQTLDLNKVAQQFSLKEVEREDRGRVVTFYQNSEDQDVIKKLYPGYGIVFNSREVAIALAKTAL